MKEFTYNNTIKGILTKRYNTCKKLATFFGWSAVITLMIMITSFCGACIVAAIFPNIAKGAGSDTVAMVASISFVAALMIFTTLHYWFLEDVNCSFEKYFETFSKIEIAKHNEKMARKYEKFLM